VGEHLIKEYNKNMEKSDILQKYKEIEKLYSNKHIDEFDVFVRSRLIEALINETELSIDEVCGIVANALSIDRVTSTTDTEVEVIGPKQEVKDVEITPSDDSISDSTIEKEEIDKSDREHEGDAPADIILPREDALWDEIIKTMQNCLVVLQRQLEVKDMQLEIKDNQIAELVAIIKSQVENTAPRNEPDAIDVEEQIMEDDKTDNDISNVISPPSTKQNTNKRFFKGRGKNKT